MHRFCSWFCLNTKSYTLFSIHKPLGHMEAPELEGRAYGQRGHMEACLVSYYESL
jgi:hypothetical protein